MTVSRRSTVLDKDTISDYPIQNLQTSNVHPRNGTSQLGYGETLLHQPSNSVMLQQT